MSDELKILLVEDLATDAGLVAWQLRRAGINHQMTRVETQPDFVRALEDLAPQIVLSDFSMPHFNGLDALKIARELAPDTPFIFVSGNIGEEFAIESLKRGATDYILKSNMARLGSAVRRALQDQQERTARQDAERALRETQERFALFMEHLPGAAFIKDLKGRYCYVNRVWERVTARQSAEVMGRSDTQLWPDLAPQFVAIDRRAIDGNRAVQGYEQFPQADGLHTYMVQKFPIPGLAGQPVMLGGISVDFTERLRAEAKIARLSRIHALLSGINSLIVRVRDRHELFEEACRIAVKHGGFEIAWIGTRDPGTDRVTQVTWAGIDMGPQVLQAEISMDPASPLGQGMVSRAMRGGQAVFSNDLAAETGSGGARRQEALRRGICSAIVLPLTVDGTAVASLALFAREANYFNTDELKLLNELAGDISFALDHITKDERLNYLAYYDALTGLPNTTLFCERLGQQLARANAGMLAVAVLDIDRFRAINESFGRNAGDQLLTQVADCFKRVVEDPGGVARIGSNQFAAVFAQVAGATQIVHVLEEELTGSLGLVFTIAGQEVRVSTSVGVSFYPGDGDNAQTLLANAEAALNKAKKSGQRYLFYAPVMNARVAERLSLESRLRLAIDRDEFVLYYQPKIAAQSGALCGVEALLRWNDPASGLVGPNLFIPILEETGMIMEVGKWVLKQAAADCRNWIGQGVAPLRIAVNVSALQLRDPNFVSNVLDAIAAGGADCSRFDIEITESLIMEDIADNICKLQALRQAGMGVAIDDFGTGHSSLKYLARLPVTTLKIDRAFVDTMQEDTDSMAIVSSIISLTHALKLKVVAEGVETAAQAELLRSLNCDELQGFFFSKPRPAAEIGAMAGRA